MVNHIAIILDGNRRYAKKLLLKPWKGHEFGRKKVEEILQYSKELGINEITFYALSQENIINRPKIELDYLFKIFKEMFENMNIEDIMKKSIKINFIGDITLLPTDIQKICIMLEKKTKDNKEFRTNFCIAYGGRQEITQAIKNIIKKQIQLEDITPELIQENLLLKTEPEIIIRTGGEKRTSNFLPWQSTYSEWFFLEKMWPEFEKQDLINIIEEFDARKRNFGK